MAVFKATKQQIDNYYNDISALNQSTLKSLLNGLNGYKNYIAKKDEQRSYLNIGSAVDTILTQGSEEFYNQFFVSKLDSLPSTTEMIILTEIFKNTSCKDCTLSQLTDDEIAPVIIQSEWQPKWKLDTKIQKIRNLGEEYYNELVLSKDKIILSDSEFNTIENMVNYLRTSENTKKYFDENLYVNNDDFDIYYQLPILFIYRDMMCKALLDIVIHDKKKRMVHPIDLKTTSKPILSFPNEVKHYRYDIQASFYTKALQFYFPKDHVTTFEFVVSSTAEPQFPVVFKVSPQLIDIAKNGKEPLIYKKTQIRDKVIGFDQLIDEYLWYMEHSFEVERRLVQGQGILHLEDY